jgi:hypothetical protein
MRTFYSAAPIAIIRQGSVSPDSVNIRRASRNVYMVVYRTKAGVERE